MIDAVFERRTAADSDLRVDLVVQPAVNYALVFNGVALVRSLVVTNLTESPVRDVTVSLQLTAAGVVLSSPWSRDIPVIEASSSVAISPIDDLVPDLAALGAMEEARPAVFTATVARRWGDDLHVAVGSRVLAGNEWLGAPALFEALAAFVQPNTRSVAQVLTRAADLLLQRTDSSALDGYQVSPQRASQIAAAVWDALRERQIHYVVPPASFENTGQKVRTTAQVLTDRLGTCLDLTVSYAACLEAAGLHPLILLLEGHALAGYLRDDTRLPETLVGDRNQMVNLAESGLAIPIEATLLCPGDGERGFAAAAEAGRRRIRTSVDELQGLLDVHLSHRSGIRPLPTPDADAAPDSGRPNPAVSVRPDAGLPIDLLDDVSPVSDPVPDVLPARIRTWEKSLLDLSLRNPLLQLPRRGKVLDLHVPAGSLPVLDDLIHARKPLQILPQDRLSAVRVLQGARRAQDIDAAELGAELRDDRRLYSAVGDAGYQAKMRGLQRDARTLTQETGSNYLFLTLGALIHDGPSGEARAPLFLLPVRIDGGVGNKPYSITIDGTEVASANHCLQEWLRVRHGITLDVLTDPPLDDSGIDITRALTAARRQLADAQLGFRIDEDASLAILQFATFQMWRDLIDHWPTFLRNPVVRHLVETPGQTFMDPADAGADVVVDETDLLLPIAADGSQMKAVAMAAAGRSFVLEGPPGTGKSQTITNLIANTIAQGRTVLFVAEKQAALDVVKDRLTRLGLDAFALDLHGRKQSNRAIREQLLASLSAVGADDPAQWSVTTAHLRSRIASLRALPRQVHDRGPGDWSAWSAHESVLAHGDGPVADVPVAYLELEPSVRARAEEATRDLPASAEAAPVFPPHPWSLSHLGVVSGTTRTDVETAAAGLEQARAGLTALTPRQRAALRSARAAPDPTDLAVLGAFAELAEASAKGLLSPDSPRSPESASQSAGALGLLEAYHRQHAAVLATVRSGTFTDAPLPVWDEAAGAAEHGIFGRGKRRKAVAATIAPWLREGQTVDPDSVRRLTTDLVAAGADAAALVTALSEIPGLRLPERWAPTDPAARKQLEAALRVTAQAARIRNEHPSVWDGLVEPVTREQATAATEIYQAWLRWQELLAVDTVSWRRWSASETDWLRAWEQTGPIWLAESRSTGLVALGRWVAVDVHLSELAGCGLAEFVNQLLRGEISVFDADLALARGVAHTALLERLASTGLDLFDSRVRERNAAGYLDINRQLCEQWTSHSATELLSGRPVTPNDVRGRAGEFVRALKRVRGGLSFRELYGRYREEVLSLTPCLLTSPTALATFIPAGGEPFDLVVFDEASQIRVAQSIGAMGRGRSVVVVGDSKQMPPSTTMQVTRDTDEADDPEAAVTQDFESILTEAVDSGLPQEWLSWHYRSQDETLIAFSNERYYGNRLASLPSPGRSPGTGLSWRRVDGVFGRSAGRTNPEEARAIVDEIAARITDPTLALQSIGVVTLNIQQRDLILDLLEKHPDGRVRDRVSAQDESSVFVKNLESVQGDERDVILFSLAFSRDPATGRLPLNFGPLTQSGGERRWNVAITRARRQVVVFSSFDPADVDLARTSSRGAADLRAYLEMAAREGDAAVLPATALRRIDSQFATIVVEALRSRGLEVATGVGRSRFTVDIAVRKPGSPRWQLAVLLDAPAWAALPTVADQEVPPRLLADLMGWAGVARVWLASWIQDKARVVDEIAAALEVAAARDARHLESATTGNGVGQAVSDGIVDQGTGVSPVTPETAAPEPTGGGEPRSPRRPGSSPAESSTSLPSPGTAQRIGPAAEHPAEPVLIAGEFDSRAAVSDRSSVGRQTVRPTRQVFVPAGVEPAGSPGDLDRLRVGSVQRLVRNQLKTIVEFEGPIQRQRLARVVGQRFGLLRVSAERADALLELVPDDVKRGPADDLFIWPVQVDPDVWRVYRTSSSEVRSFHHIALEEIANAMLDVALSTRNPTNEFMRASMEALGYHRLTDQIRERLTAAAALGVLTGRLIRVGDTYLPGL